MKTKIYSIIASSMLMLAALLFFASCDDVSSGGTTEKYCHDKDLLYCDTDGGKCCDTSTPWHDGHGTCYSSQSYCRGSGWACVRCH